MAARKKKRELSEKAQKQYPAEKSACGDYGYCSHRDYFLRDSVHIMAVCEQGG